MNSIRLGLLPLFLRFYDEVLPQLASNLEPFVDEVSQGLARHGVSVERTPVLRTLEQTESAIRDLSASGVEALATLHLAYAPSLEAAPALASSSLPLVLLDTTPDRDFGLGTDPARLLQNHGIHGVQDLASVLRRLGKPFRVVAGHLQDPEFLRRCRLALQAAKAAHRLRTMRVLRIGRAFPGMGDFSVADEDLQAGLGPTVDCHPVSALNEVVRSIGDSDLEAEAEADGRRFNLQCPRSVLDRSNRVGLGLRRHLEAGRYGAFSLNFLCFDSERGPVDTVPFLECCKAMARGTGYAGEGDVLTAALTGAMLQGFARATFTEMFCPDWEGSTVFLSHMGEFNPAVASSTPVLYEKEFPFTPARNPATLAAAPESGPAVLVNLAPGPNRSFGLIAAPVEVLGDGTHPDLQRWVRGWVRPSVPLPDFLESFSHHGGTHHSVLLLGVPCSAVVDFGHHLGLRTTIIR